MSNLIWIFSCFIALNLDQVSARYCEGGNHKCLPPKECCAQGCCYLYSPPSNPRAPQPADHVLNLFFINHWYFWLFLFAIMIAVLLFCSLWKKRHIFFCTGWSSSSSRRVPSGTTLSGGSVGSCYAPPHYSRCGSFFHSPPPYTEVLGKPDMYPLVFSNNSHEGSKNAGNYLMVQYFRNYIVRPIGSADRSLASTADSLSSFICTANESNTMIPPPYSSAASPDGLSLSIQNYAVHRSASQQVHVDDTLTAPQIYIENNSSNRPMSVPNTNNHGDSFYQFRSSGSANMVNLFVHQMPTNANSTMTKTNTIPSSMAFHENSIHSNHNNHNYGSRSDSFSDENDESFKVALMNSTRDNAESENIELNQIPRIFESSSSALSLSTAADKMMDKISYSRQTNDNTKLNLIQKQLEKCCEMIQQQHQIQQTQSSFNATSSFDSETSMGGDINKKITQTSILGLGFVNSNTGSTVSSLANLNSPGSPPQATSPTSPAPEVKQLFDQIRNLKEIYYPEDEQPTAHSSNYQRDASSNSTSILKTSLTRPTTLHSKRRFFSVKNRSIYLPVANNGVTSPVGFTNKLRSPISPSASVFMMKNRSLLRTGFMSKSAPTTPAGMPCINDHSPLLNEHDEDAEADQGC